MKNAKNAQFDTHNLPQKDLLEAGINLKSNSSAIFLQVDNNVKGYGSFFDGVELLPTQQAKKDPRFAAYYNKALLQAGKKTDDDPEGGFFLYVKANTHIVIPVQICLFLKSKFITQKVHNVILVEEGAKVYVINGCVSDKASEESLHFGISEYYIKAGAYLNFTMIHSWNKEVKVNPVSAAIVEEKGVFVSNYVCLKPVKSIKMYPICILEGKESRASFGSLIVGHSGGRQDIGSGVILKGLGSSAEIVSRAVSMGGEIVMRGILKAESPKVKAHLECQGLVVSERGLIHAIPELATQFADVDMSHEAAIGKVSKEEIEYLASRGIEDSQAQSIIIRGFIDTDILGLPEELRKQIDHLKDKLTESAI